MDGWQNTHDIFFGPGVVSWGKTLHTTTQWRQQCKLSLELNIDSMTWFARLTKPRQASFGISLGKVFDTNFPVLSETDVKPGGPPDGKTAHFCIHERLRCWSAARAMCMNVFVAHQVNSAAVVVKNMALAALHWRRRRELRLTQQRFWIIIILVIIHRGRDVPIWEIFRLVTIYAIL